MRPGLENPVQGDATSARSSFLRWDPLRILLLVVWLGSLIPRLDGKQVPSPVTLDPAGRLVYGEGERGDRVPDFSHAGFGGGGVPWPEVPSRVRVSPGEGEDGARIQAAIDHVSSLPMDAAGLRGAVELEAGRFEVAGQLKIRTSGVVLRGAGSDERGSILVATGTDRRALIELAGSDRRRVVGGLVQVTAERVPVGATRLRLATSPTWEPGLRVTVERPSTSAWISALGLDDAPGRQPYAWKAGAYNVAWDRVVVKVEGDAVTLDAPLTVALTPEWGGATVTPYVQEGYLQNVGIEHLRCVSDYDRARPMDEDHAWNAIDLHAVRDAWVADVTALHFAGSAVQVGAKAERVTVQDCQALAPVSERGGYRRMAFHSRGQQVLFVRCQSEQGGNDFTTGYLSAGPNVFLDCTARETRGFSGSVGSWSSGLLMDGVKIDGGALRFDHLETWNQGVGWSVANSMIWGSEASIIICRSPPGARNWAVAVWGQFVGDGDWSQVNEFARPSSLYRAQLAERLGASSLAGLEPRRYRMTGSAPSVETVVPDLHQRLRPRRVAEGKPLQQVRGWLTAGGSVIGGTSTEGAWWLGRLEPARASEAGPALTRFAPGRTGTGLTDEIPAVAAGMLAKGQVAFRHHYGLWYDRRRIDHQMVRRPDGDVYPPFFEQPFARSGVGTAWDGLSRYDLTRYNPWYFGRLRAFAEQARQDGLVLIQEMYFQHNLLESGAHWVDSPWRPVNNVNETGFVEPPPFTGDTIRMAEAFYDVTHPVRRGLHRAYIRQCLSALAGQPNVIHTLTAENSGPLAFMQFWLDVVKEWERETGQSALIALSAPKDVQDAILADPERVAQVDVIDLAYWFRTDDGREFAPEGGTRLAPRQHARLWKGGRPSAASIAGLVRELRLRFPDKAVISPLPEAAGWAVLAAGASLVPLPAEMDPGLRRAIVSMQPQPEGGLAEPGRQGLYVVTTPPLRVDLHSLSGAVMLHSIDPTSGRISESKSVPVEGSLTLDRAGIFWITRPHTP